MINVKSFSQLHTQKGFTLTELLMVVVIVGILAAIAIPAYNDQAQRARRADGKAYLMHLTSLQERFFTQYISYTSVLTGPGGCTGAACGLNLDSLSSTEGMYTMSVTVQPAGCSPTAATRCRTYELTATPVQADPKCTTISITNTGEKKATPAANSEYCWR